MFVQVRGLSLNFISLVGDVHITAVNHSIFTYKIKIIIIILWN